MRAGHFSRRPSRSLSRSKLRELSIAAHKRLLILEARLEAVGINCHDVCVIAETSLEAP